MNIALLSESPVDEAALRVLVAGVLGQGFNQVAPTLRARGWPSVELVLPAILRHLHFNTRADGLVVVVDSDDTPIHTAEHEAPGYYHPHCRLCRLRAVFRRTIKNLPPAQGRDRVLRAVGLCVPALEAWIDQAATGPDRFIILGDWNRRLGLAGDAVWTEIDDGEPANADLRLADEGISPKCDPRYDSFIDHIVLDKRAAADMLAFAETLYAPGEKHYSDHCPVMVTLGR